MALFELYIQTTGSNLNAGTDNSMTPVEVSGTSSLNTSTGVLTFTAASSGAFTPGSGAAATATVTDGVITALTLTNGGSGYQLNTLITFTGGGTGASAYATVSGGVIAGLTLISGGSGYTSPTVNFGTFGVGSWVSFYNSGDLLSRITGQVATIDITNTIITINTTTSSPYYSTTGLGVASALTGTVNCRWGGPWANLSVTGTNGVMNNTVPYANGSPQWSGTYNGLRVNVKSGTYSHTTAISTPPATYGRPLFWRGYSSSPGDLDGVANPGTHPVFAFTSSGSLTVLAHNRLENIDMTHSGSASNCCNANQRGVWLTRCRLSSTKIALQYDGTSPGCNFYACYFSSTGTTAGTQCVYVNATSNVGVFTQCIFQGGYYALQIAGAATFTECIFRNSTLHLVYASGSFIGGNFTRCSFYNSGSSSDGILINGSSDQFISVLYCIFDTIKRYAINQGGTNNIVRSIGNAYYNCTSGQLNGVPESYQILPITESSSPYTAASASDFSIVSTSNVAGQTFVFESP